MSELHTSSCCVIACTGCSEYGKAVTETVEKIATWIEPTTKPRCCDWCGKYESDNHDLPGMCDPDPERISKIKLARAIREREW